MGIYLPNIEIPADNTVLIRVFPASENGECYVQQLDVDGDILDELWAVPVPAHGRLIDADALTVKLQRHREYHLDGSNSGAAISNGIGQCLDIINGKECPTIIPASEEDET